MRISPSRRSLPTLGPDEGVDVDESDMIEKEGGKGDEKGETMSEVNEILKWNAGCEMGLIGGADHFGGSDSFQSRLFLDFFGCLVFRTFFNETSNGNDGNRTDDR